MAQIALDQRAWDHFDGASEAEYLSTFDTHPNMGISSMALKSKVMLMLIQTILFSAQSTQNQTNPCFPPLFHSPTAPAPPSSISFPSPPIFCPRIIFLLRTSSSVHPNVSNRCKSPSHDRISHPIIPTLHHHDSISDPSRIQVQSSSLSYQIPLTMGHPNQFVKSVRSHPFNISSDKDGFSMIFSPSPSPS